MKTFINFFLHLLFSYPIWFRRKNKQTEKSSLQKNMECRNAIGVFVQLKTRKFLSVIGVKLKTFRKH